MVAPDTYRLENVFLGLSPLLQSDALRPCVRQADAQRALLCGKEVATERILFPGLRSEGIYRANIIRPVADCSPAVNRYM